LYESLASLECFRKSNADLFLLRAAGYLHDVGYPPDENHNIKGFNLLKPKLEGLVETGTLSKSDLRIILHCVLWHRKDNFKQIDAEVKLNPQELPTARRLAAILRIADGLSFPDGRPTSRVSAFKERNVLVIEACPSEHGKPLDIQILHAKEKHDLLEEVLKTSPELGVNKVEIRRCSHEK
jgi:hypothetical protein